MTALSKPESGVLSELAGAYCEHLPPSDFIWKITVNTMVEDSAENSAEDEEEVQEDISIDPLQKGLNFNYPYLDATKFPSKQTATQLKGRVKDQEAAENTQLPKHYLFNWKVPSFADKKEDGGVSFGNLIHSIMQHIDFSKCDDLEGVTGEIKRLSDSGLVPKETSDIVDPVMIWNFFATEEGTQLRNKENVLREFKFSLLDDGIRYHKGLTDDKILLQGVVDCAVLEPDGITVLDFKTDKVTGDTLEQVAAQYRRQVEIYADAMSRIYQQKIKSAKLYFFRLNRFVTVI